MKYWMFFLSLAIFFSCNSDDDNLSSFEMKYQDDFFINAGLNPFEAHYYENTIQSNAEFLFNANDVEASQIVRANPSSARISTIFSAEDYDFIQRISVFMFPVGQEELEKEIFYRENVPLNTASFLDLIPTLVDAGDFVKLEDFRIKIRYELRDISPSTIETRLEFNFDAKYE